MLLIQKSILRDATTEMALHYLAKAKILVVRDVERDEIEFVTKTLNCLPITHVDNFRQEKMGFADLVEEVSVGSGKIVKITGIQNMGKTATVLVRGSNKVKCLNCVSVFSGRHAPTTTYGALGLFRVVFHSLGCDRVSHNLCFNKNFDKIKSGVYVTKFSAV